MVMRILGLTAALALAVAVSSYAGGKPPDLPAATREAVTPELEVVQEVQARPAGSLPAKPTGPKLASARRLYRIGERCRREGDLDMAYNCYTETHLLAPRSVYGRRAQQRLKEIEQRRAREPRSEAAPEPPRPMPQRRTSNPQ